MYVQVDKCLLCFMAITAIDKEFPIKPIGERNRNHHRSKIFPALNIQYELAFCRNNSLGEDPEK